MRPNLIPLDVAPGLVEDDSSFKVRQGGYKSINNMRPHRGGLEVIGGWEFLTTSTLGGLCRGGHCWRDNDGEINFAFGTHTGLYVLKGGALYNITPADFVAGNADGFGGGGYGAGTYGTGAYGVATEGIYYPLTWTLDNREGWLIANPRGGKIYVWKNDPATVAVELAGRTTAYDADFTSYADQTAFDVDYTRGTGWTFDATDDEADCDGTQTGNSDLEYTATGLTPGERYRVTVTFDGRTAGAISAIGRTSEGTGSSDGSGSVAVVFIATSTSHTVGARADVDFVGSVTDIKVEQMGAPEIVESVLVTATGQICAYGCEEELETVQNPRCVRWCSVQTSLELGFDDWTSKATNSAGGYILRNSGRLLRAKEVGESLIGVWTDSGFSWQSFVGDPSNMWDFSNPYKNCGLVGPNALGVNGSTAYWLTPQFNFTVVAFGGEPQTLSPPIDDTFQDAQVASQQEKIFCSTISKFNEVVWFYPHSEDGNECSRYVAIALNEGAEGSWYGGELARTCWIDSSPYEYPVAVSPDGKLYLHERGVTAAGDAINWHAETSDLYLNESNTVIQIRGMKPDFKNQRGAIQAKFTMRADPQSSETDADYVTHTETITPGQKKADFRISGAIMNIRYSSDLVGATVRLGKPLYDPVGRGRR